MNIIELMTEVGITSPDGFKLTVNPVQVEKMQAFANAVIKARDAELVEGVGEPVIAREEGAISSDEYYTATQVAAAVLAKLQAQSEPVALRYDFDGYGWQYLDSGSGSNWKERVLVDKQFLYTAPMQAQSEPVNWNWVDLQNRADEIVRGKVLWKRFIDGTPLANDIACWMADFAQEVAAAPMQQESKCSTHPKAPHGFDRNGSHSAGRYVCECEGWDAYSAGYQAGIDAALRSDE